MGALPALIWTADHPGEVAGFLYIEAPVMLGNVLRRVIAYTPEAIKEGSMRRCILPFAPEIPERLIVGNERAFSHLVLRQRLPILATWTSSDPPATPWSGNVLAE